MTAYEALVAAYRDKAGIAGDNPDAGMGNLFDGIAGFAESDAGESAATAQELEFLASVLQLAARSVMGDDVAASNDGAAGNNRAAQDRRAAAGRPPAPAARQRTDH